MDYGYKRQINVPFEKTEEKLCQALKEEGFGVIAEIDELNDHAEQMNLKLISAVDKI